MNIAIVEQSYKKIPLANSNYFTIVDTEDYHHLAKWRWHLTRSSNKQSLAYRSSSTAHHRYLHKEILGLHYDNVASVTHLNGDTLDNRKSNLKATRRIRKDRVEKKGYFSWLSERDKELAFLVAECLSTKLISEKLNISSHTVENHLIRINKFLGINNRTELASLAWEFQQQHVKSREFSDLPDLPPHLKNIADLKSQRLLSAQMIVDSKRAIESTIAQMKLIYYGIEKNSQIAIKPKNALADQISQLQQIYADLEQTLKVMKP